MWKASRREKVKPKRAAWGDVRYHCSAPWPLHSASERNVRDPLDLTAEKDAHCLREARVSGKSLQLSFITCLSPLFKNENLPTVVLSFHPACVPAATTERGGRETQYTLLFSTLWVEGKCAVSWWLLDVFQITNATPIGPCVWTLVPIGWRYLGRRWNLQEVKPY